MRRSWVLGMAVVAVGGFAAIGLAIGVRAQAPVRVSALVVRGGAPAASTASPGTITVVGSAQVAATTLQASFTVGVDHQAATAAAALSGNNALMAKVIAALEHQGVPATQLQTTNLSVNPVYSQSADGEQGPITGFDANDTLAVTVNSLARVGHLIDSALGAGANNLGGVSFTAVDLQQLQAQALAAAEANAHMQAQALASAAGLTLGPATTITTQTQQVGPIYAGVHAAMAFGALTTPTPVLSGQQNVSEQVTVTFATQVA